jgi:acetoin utilization deacetylase AcuC-like enzyme
METPPAAMDQVVAPEERPRNTHRLGDASNVVPAYENEYTDAVVVSVASVSAAVRAPQPLSTAVTVRPPGHDAKKARSAAPLTDAAAVTVVTTLA